MTIDEFRPFEPSPETELTNDMAHLAEGWEALGIDPDDFLRCSACSRFIRELAEGTDPPLADHEYCVCPDDETH